MKEAIDTVEQAVALMERLGVNPLYAVSVVVLTTMFKSFDWRNKFKQGYVLFPIVAGLLVCLLSKPFVVEKWITQGLVHAALGGYGYTVYDKLVRGKSKAQKDGK